MFSWTFGIVIKPNDKENFRAAAMLLRNFFIDVLLWPTLFQAHKLIVVPRAAAMLLMVIIWF
jgi:hypothetical protein